MHVSAWKVYAAKSVCSIAHSSVATGPKTPDNPIQGPKADTHMSWHHTKMRSPAWGRFADDGRPSRSMVGDIGSEWSAAPGGARRMGHREGARRNGTLADRYDHDVDELMA
jgi:hypothetical protein